MTDAAQLEGRVARCPHCKTEVPSTNAGLAFFQFRGEGSRAATEICKHCNYSREAHGPHAPKWKNEKTAVQNAGCPGFEEHGPWEYDLYYSGCRGWE